MANHVAAAPSPLVDEGLPVAAETATCLDAIPAAESRKPLAIQGLASCGPQCLFIPLSHRTTQAW
jgi:hypothetical protein